MTSDCECKNCGYEWVSKLDKPNKPKSCPDCKSRTWDTKVNEVWQNVYTINSEGVNNQDIVVYWTWLDGKLMEFMRLNIPKLIKDNPHWKAKAKQIDVALNDYAVLKALSTIALDNSVPLMAVMRKFNLHNPLGAKCLRAK
jgi:hypothetical protein